MPDWFWNLSSRAFYLNISHNQISGSIPQSLTIFPGISIIDLRSNLLQGSLPHLSSGVEFLYLSDNMFTGELLPILKQTTHTLSSVLLSGNLVTGSIPLVICEMFMLEVLDLSSNRLSGEIPPCTMAFSLLSAINLANNNLSGVIPNWIGSLVSLQSLHLSNNSFHGGIPSLENCTELYILDLGENKLRGNIPSWIGESLSSLKMLRLRQNTLQGSIPQELSHLAQLHVLDLADNQLSGIIPRLFGNLSAMATTEQTINEPFISAHSFQKVDYEGVDLSAIYKESLLVAIKGRELEYSNTLSLVVTLDLSGNDLHGEIPEELTNLFGLQSLNLSKNHLKGKIPGNIGALRQLESLDLSKNQLSGAIPSSIASLTYLGHLNLSNNNFSGRIPSGNQLQALIDPSIYSGNSNLCGVPLLTKCPGDETTKSTVSSLTDDDDDDSENLWFYLGMAPGYVVGFWIVWGILLFKKSWRIAFFQFLDCMTDKIYVVTAVKLSQHRS